MQKGGHVFPEALAVMHISYYNGWYRAQRKELKYRRETCGALPMFWAYVGPFESGWVAEKIGQHDAEFAECLLLRAAKIVSKTESVVFNEVTRILDCRNIATTFWVDRLWKLRVIEWKKRRNYDTSCAHGKTLQVLRSIFRGSGAKTACK